MSGKLEINSMNYKTAQTTGVQYLSTIYVATNNMTHWCVTYSRCVRCDRMASKWHCSLWAEEQNKKKAAGQ